MKNKCLRNNAQADSKGKKKKKTNDSVAPRKGRFYIKCYKKGTQFYMSRREDFLAP